MSEHAGAACERSVGGTGTSWVEGSRAEAAWRHLSHSAKVAKVAVELAEGVFPLTFADTEVSRDLAAESGAGQV